MRTIALVLASVLAACSAPASTNVYVIAAPTDDAGASSAPDVSDVATPLADASGALEADVDTAPDASPDAVLFPTPADGVTMTSAGVLVSETAPISGTRTIPGAPSRFVPVVPYTLTGVVSCDLVLSVTTADGWLVTQTIHPAGPGDGTWTRTDIPPTGHHYGGTIRLAFSTTGCAPGTAYFVRTSTLTFAP